MNLRERVRRALLRNIGGLSSPAHETVPQAIVDAVADLSI